MEAAERFSGRVAVIDPGYTDITYRQLAELSGRLRDRLYALGVEPRDRVGLYMRKSTDAVAAIYGILRAGATYVPVDPGAPPARNAYIMHNCDVKAVLVEARMADKFQVELQGLGALPHLIVLDDVGGGLALTTWLDNAEAAHPTSHGVDRIADRDDLAYILYTSGSTGRPKGVMLSHENAVSFVDWCSEVFEPTPEDTFSSHAPFHFDLSILDLHVSLKHGASLVLITEDLGKDPVRLVKLIAEYGISIWYSAPSILSLLAQFGNLGSYQFPALRHVLFAGEVFPVKHLRMLCSLWPKPRYFNLYGPTETNVCTFYEVATPIPEERTVPYPIGKVCSHLNGKVVDEIGQTVEMGVEGELCIAGQGVMQGYWSLPEQTAKSFLAGSEEMRWYKTGDIVVEEPDGNYLYRGRRDRMVKRRGYRVELGEIEVGLYKHPQVKEVAVVAVPDEESGLKVVAHLSCKTESTPSLIEMKRFCSEHLPLYMIPDRFAWQPALPKTSTDKIDYQRLKELS
ncbi:MAG: amino acid adenylation domain-containing protein [Gammaproteobacteria bacterium]|nr:amino acid adenylation domain-containing protein [Gammaproteobacteria bacterium]MCP5198241.1 amino acid adenylation domain-containing protein [Gammaproteobacteria bacterium]